VAPSRIGTDAAAKTNVKERAASARPASATRRANWSLTRRAAARPA